MLFFGLFYLLPLTVDLGGGMDRAITKNVGVPPDHFFSNTADNLFKIENVFGVVKPQDKKEQKENIPKFLTDSLGIAAFYRFDQFKGFLDQIYRHGGGGLPAVPRAAVFPPERINQPAQ